MSVELGTEKMLMRVYVEREHALKISQSYDAQHSLQELSLLSSSNTVKSRASVSPSSARKGFLQLGSRFQIVGLVRL